MNFQSVAVVRQDISEKREDRFRRRSRNSRSWCPHRSQGACETLREEDTAGWGRTGEHDAGDAEHSRHSSPCRGSLFWPVPDIRACQSRTNVEPRRIAGESVPCLLGAERQADGAEGEPAVRVRRRRRLVRRLSTAMVAAPAPLVVAPTAWERALRIAHLDCLLDSAPEEPRRRLKRLRIDGVESLDSHEVPRDREGRPDY